MSDLKQKILDIITKPQLAGFATLTREGVPWVRYVVTVGDDSLNIRFASFVESRKVLQVKENPEVHLTCGVNSFENITPYLQIQGRARVTTSSEERHGFWSDMLAPIFEGPDDPDYCVVVVEPYRIEYCTPDSFEPEVWQK